MAKKPRIKKPRRPKRRTKISAEELKNIRDKMVKVKCAFCNGTGKDPFGLLSHLSDCQVCLGKGEVEILGPVVTCNFCHGSGIQPYTTSRLHCLACGGVGVVTKITPSRKCPVCKETGIYPRRPHPVACHICHGQGVVPK